MFNGNTKTLRQTLGKSCDNAKFGGNDQKFDCFQGYPPVIAGLADMYYDRVIDAVTPDPEVAVQAKDFHKMILEEVRKKS